MAVTELRVHGVGGSTAEGVLNTGPPVLVAGDGQSGFYGVAGREEDDPRLEAYCWGTLTSGARTRALWLLMLPFTLVNASFWMGPVRRSAWADRLVRLLALSLTSTALLAAAGVGTDLLGWQCAAQEGCRGRHAFLRFLGSGVLATPGRRAAVGTLVPLAVLLLLWVLSRRTGKAYEEVDQPTAPDDGVGLADPSFWRGAARLAYLRALHLAVGLATVAMTLAFLALDADWQERRGLGVVDLELFLTGVVVLLLAGAGVWNAHDEARTSHTRALALAWTALALLVVTALVLVVPEREGWRAEGPLPGYGFAITALFLLQLAGVMALGVVGKRAGRGLTQAAFAALGLLVAALFTAGLVFRVADWLNGGRAATDEAGLVVPEAFGWAALGFTAVAVPAAVVVVVLVRRHLDRVRDARIPPVEAAYGGPHGRVPEVARTQAWASLTDAGLRWLQGLVWCAVAAAVVAMACDLLLADPPAQVFDSGFAADLLRLGTLSGTWAVSLVAAGLVALGLQAYRRPGLRRTVGILWDVGTFWPRAAHPLAPPSYAERAVPDLAVRVRHLAQEGVVLSAHSQGSVLAAALVFQLPGEAVSRVRLVTHGSPLARLYGTVFPCWFGPAVLEALQRRVGWTNLWRWTDPIGGPVHLPVDVEVPRDPARLDPLPGDPASPAPRGHSDFDRTEEHRAAVARAVRELQSTMDG